MANTTDTTDTEPTPLVDQIRGRYGQIARQVLDGGSRACCGGGDGPATPGLYTDDETSVLPRAAAEASLGCGNPTALTDLHDGDVVLDLGSGGGIDVLLSARRVAPTGFAYGLDMTDEMLELARRNQADAAVENVEFLKGRMEDIPLPDDSVDVIISNCVINLSSDKAQVLRESFRVLRPGGRFAVSDIVVRGAIDQRVRESVEAWIGCVAGALEEGDYRSLLAQAGFTDVEIVPTHVYGLADAEELIAAGGIDVAELADVEGQLMSAFVRARKQPAE